jgi:hypothetical protein
MAMKLPTPPDARAEPWSATDKGQFVGLELAQLGKALRRQHVAGDVGHDFRQIADTALSVDHARSGAPKRTSFAPRRT